MIGAKVRLIRQVTLYRDRLCTEIMSVIPEGAYGVVTYLPKEDDPKSDNDLGVLWEEQGVGVEVLLSDVALLS
jgi:hypothetical protein